MFGVIPCGMYFHHCDFLRIGRFPQTDKPSSVLCFIVRVAARASRGLVSCAKNNVSVGLIDTYSVFTQRQYDDQCRNANGEDLRPLS